MIANSRQKWHFADSLGGEKYNFFKKHFKHMMPKPLQTHPSDCGFYTTYVASHLLMFRQEEKTGVGGFIVLSFESNYV